MLTRPSIWHHALIALIAIPTAALAQTAPPDEPYRYSEVRIGALAHDVSIAGGKEGGVDLNIEWTSSSLVSPDWTAGAPQWLQFVLHPRFNIGLEPNLNGKTSQAYAGLTWTALLAQGVFRSDDAIEFSFLFGPAINNGNHYDPYPGHKSLGSNVLFHPGLELTYRFSPGAAVGIYFDHSSNASFARYNESLNDLGLRLSFRF